MTITLSTKQLELLADMITKRLNRKLVTAKEAAEILGIFVKYLYQIKDRYPYTMKGRKIFFDRECLS